jgi:Tol biopolymer transport system component
MGAAHFDVSQNGSIVYLAGPVSFDAALVRDVAVVRAGNVKRLSLPAMPYEFPALSPDGKALALSADDGKSSNVWVYDLSATGPPRQLTFQGRNRFPIWSEDGKRITFQSDREGDLALFSQAADGGEAAVRLTTPEAGAAHVPHAWSPDGASLLFSVELPQATFSLWAFNNRGHTSTRVETVRPSTVMPAGAFSPDGKLVAYQAGELGQVHIAVQPFPVTGAQWTFPNTNSRHPRWSRDGSRLFLTRGPDLIQVDIARQPAFRFLNTTTVMTAQAGQTFGPMYPNYDVWMDDSFITPITAEGVMSGSTLAIRQVNVVLNWLEELKRLVPTN